MSYTPTPAQLQTLHQAMLDVAPYWIEFCRSRTDQALQAGEAMWVAAEAVLGRDPTPITNVRVVTISDDGVLIETDTSTVTHAVWCPDPIFPLSNRPACPYCGAPVVTSTSGGNVVGS